MGSGCIADLINGLHCRIDCRIKADGVIGTCNIQVNGSRKANGIDPQGGQAFLLP